MRSAVAVLLSGLLLGGVQLGCRSTNQSTGGGATADASNGSPLDERTEEVVGPNAQNTPPAPYTLRDTFQYETMIHRSWAATLYEGETLVDTIDAIFGVQRVGPDSVLFLPVARERTRTGEDWIGLQRHVLYTGGRRIPIAERAPCFDAYFSSSWVLNGLLYYWGLCEGQGQTQLYAMRYRFSADVPVDSLHLQSGITATDVRFLLRPPRRTDDAVVYEGEGTRWVIDPTTFELVRTTPLSEEK